MQTGLAGWATSDWTTGGGQRTGGRRTGGRCAGGERQTEKDKRRTGGRCAGGEQQNSARPDSQLGRTPPHHAALPHCAAPPRIRCATHLLTHESLLHSLEQYLRAFVSDQCKQWTSFLVWAEYWYNTTHHSAIRMSPFQAVYGRSPLPLPCFADLNSGVPVVDHTLLNRSALVQQLREHLLQAQNRMVVQANKHRKDVEFAVGTYVLLKLQPYRQRSLVRREFQKLSKRFYGPFMILERVGMVAYKLDLPAHSQVHPVFHVSLLKLWKGPLPPDIKHLPQLAIANHPVIIPEAILSCRIVLVNGKPVREVLVKWKDCPKDECSWESFGELAGNFPSLHLEDKVIFNGRGGDSAVNKFPVLLDFEQKKGAGNLLVNADEEELVTGEGSILDAERIIVYKRKKRATGDVRSN